MLNESDDRLPEEEQIAYIETTPGAEVTDAALTTRYFELKYGEPGGRVKFGSGWDNPPVGPQPIPDDFVDGPSIDYTPPNTDHLPDWACTPQLVAERQQRRERERRQRLAATPAPPSGIRLPRGRDRHPGRPPASRVRASACTPSARDPGDDSGDGPSELPALDGPSLFDLLRSITPGLDGAARMALFYRLPEDTQQAFWRSLANRPPRAWSA
jgi:hypothetical protein